MDTGMCAWLKEKYFEKYNKREYIVGVSCVHLRGDTPSVG